MQTRMRHTPLSSGWIFIAMISIVLITLSQNATAKEVTYEGTIQGLNCTYYHKPCPKDNLDIYADLESDFVLALPDGKFYLLPNLSKIFKARHLTENVRIRGNQSGDSIRVDTVEVKKNGEYKNIWDRDLRHLKGWD